MYEDWQVSGLTQSEFCKTRNLSLATFGYHRTRYLRRIKSKNIVAENHKDNQSKKFVEIIPDENLYANKLLELSIEKSGLLRFSLDLHGFFDR